MRKIIITLSLVLLLTIFTSGCRPQERPVPETPRQMPQQQLREDQMDGAPLDGYPREELPGVPPEDLEEIEQLEEQEQRQPIVPGNN